MTSPQDGYLDPVALDATPGGAFASHRARANGIARFYAYTHPLENFVARKGETRRFDEDASFALIAHLHAAGQDAAFKAEKSPEPSRTLVSKVLHTWTPGDGRVGTKRDYDMALKGLMTATYRYRQLLSASDLDFIAGTLVPGHLVGGHRPETEIYEAPLVKDPVFDTVVLLDKDVPETENHLLMIESSRYLFNQLLVERGSGDSEHDNAANGLRDWLLGYLQVIAKHDFLEFNSRPYARLALHPLFNLVEFARDEFVRTAARILLDYTMMKYAVSSSRGRRVSPFRRQQHRINHVANNHNDLFSTFGDPITGVFAAYTGFIDAAGKPARMPETLAGATALIAATSSYRPPPEAYLIALDSSTPPALHRFSHGLRPRLTASPDQADGGVEIYYRSPSFTLSAGGNFLNSGYGYDEYDVGPLNSWLQTSRAQATTLIPTRAEVDYADLVRFEPWPDLESDPYGDDPDEPVAERPSSVNLGVHRRIIAGANLRPAEKKTVLEHTTSHALAVCAHEDRNQESRLMAAWKGSGNDRINVARVLTTTQLGIDGVEGVGRVMTGSFTTDVAPAIASQSGRLVLAWKGVGNHKLNFAFSFDDGRSFSWPVTLSETSALSPALTAHNGRFVLAWVGEGNQKLNVAKVKVTLGVGGVVWDGIEEKVVVGETSDAAPALASHDGRLVLGWRGSGNGQLNLALSEDDGWTFGGKAVLSDKSSHGPSLAVHDGRLHVAWKGVGSNVNLNVARVVLQSTGGGAISVAALEAKTTLPESATEAPAIGSAKGLLHLAWRGRDNNNLNFRVSRDTQFATPGPWIFANREQLGFHLAAYRAPTYMPNSDPDATEFPEPWMTREQALHDFGFVFVDEATERTYEEFCSRILSRNAHLPSTLDHDSVHLFNAPNGATFHIWFGMQGSKYRARITERSDPVRDLEGLPLVSGEYLSSPHGHDGYLEVRHPACGVPLVLDYGDALHPTIADNMQRCPLLVLARAESLREFGYFELIAGRHIEGLTALREQAGILDLLAASNPTEFTPRLALALTEVASHRIPSELGSAVEAANRAVLLYRELAGVPEGDILPDLTGYDVNDHWAGLQAAWSVLAEAYLDDDAKTDAARCIHNRVRVCEALAQSTPDPWVAVLAQAVEDLTLTE